jgi:preprotein translocase subunit SecF
MAFEEAKTLRGTKPFPYMRWKWPFIFVSVIFMVLSLYEVAVKGLDFGVDFLGGTKITAVFTRDIGEDKIRGSVEKLGFGDVQIVPFEIEDKSKNAFILRVKYIEGKDAPRLMKDEFAKVFTAEKFQFLSEEFVGPRVGEDLKRKGVLSMILACALILVYVGFRFDFLFAPGAIVALIHDVLISVGFFAFFGKEFNLPILAALLTILGYSINDTIVIYDRIRENLVEYHKRYSLSDILDISLTETLRRTIVTSLTVFIVVLVLFYMGGGVLHDFAFCMMVGVVFGSYSSIFIASPIYMGLQRLFPNRGMVRLTPDGEKKRPAPLAA